MAVNGSGLMLRGTMSPEPHPSKKGGSNVWQSRPHSRISQLDAASPISYSLESSRYVGNVADLKSGTGWLNDGESSPSLTARAITPALQSTRQTAKVVNKPKSPHKAKSQGSKLATSSTKEPAKPQMRRYKSSHADSFVDELLFGPKLAEPEFEAPWEKPSDHKPKVYSLDCTDYKAKSSNKHSKTSPQPDEVKSDFHNVSNATTRPLSHMSQPSSQLSRPSSQLSGQLSARSHKGSKTSKKDSHQASYVDELLFGKGPEEPSWPAPWNDNKTVKPLTFEGSDVKVCIQHDMAVCRERKRRDLRSGGAGVRKNVSNPGARPIWK